jgi:hypothetical protein
VVWIEGSDFAEGTSNWRSAAATSPPTSFLGIAFHRKNDDTYESVYLRPFNFRAQDPDRISMPSST